MPNCCTASRAARRSGCNSPNPVWRVLVGARQGQIHRQTETRDNSLDQPLGGDIAKPIEHQFANVGSLRRAPESATVPDLAGRTPASALPSAVLPESRSPRFPALLRHAPQTTCGRIQRWTTREPDTQPAHRSHRAAHRYDSNLRRGRGRPLAHGASSRQPPSVSTSRRCAHPSSLRIKSQIARTSVRR